MENFNFTPQVGMITNDCYLHGINDLENICNRGQIEFVGRDYFILRDLSRDKPLFIAKESYGFIEENDFKIGEFEY